MTLPAREIATRDALVLRELALVLLARQSPCRALVQHACDASDTAWSLLLRAEVCAVPLDRALAQWDGSGLLPNRVREIVARHAQVELQRILTARWQLARIDALAARHGVQPCVIKGGVLLADDDRAVDVGDIDLVVRSTDVAAVTALLGELGLTPDESGPEHERHLVPFVGEGLLDVEVHQRLLYGPMVTEIAVPCRPFGPYTALRRWTATNAVLGLVLHTIEHHPHRYGSLRDLMVIAEALGELDVDERAQLRGSVAELPAHAAIAAVIGVADTLRCGERPVDDRGMRLVAALKYADMLARPRGLGLFLRSRPLPRYLPLIVERSFRIALWRAHLGRRIWPHWWRGSRWARMPSVIRLLGQALLDCWRTLRLALTAVGSVSARRRAARTVDAVRQRAVLSPVATESGRSAE